MFIAGANYGLFPDDSSSYGLFSNYEAELLGDSGLKIALRQDELYHSSRYQAYRALTLATDLLYITYPLLNTACSALAPSEAVTELLGLFPQIREENAAGSKNFLSVSISPKLPPTRRSSGTNSTAARRTLCAEGTLPFSAQPPATAGAR